MLLDSLEPDSFRNLSGKILTGPGLNIITGENGQGKTNWLEAMYVLSSGKSFRTSRPQEAVNFNQTIAVIRGTVSRGRDIKRDLQVVIQGNTKSLFLNGKRVPLARYLSELHVVAFTAVEMEVVRGAPEARRKFLDRGVLMLRSAYVHALSDYQRVIKQKKRLLQDYGEGKIAGEDTRRQIETWNEQLAPLGALIHRSRVELVSELSMALDSRLFGEEEITIRYLSALEGKGDLGNFEALLRERLRLRMEAEMASGYSLVGPHRDDLEILFDRRDIRTFGSSGQQRSALIALDLALISVYHLWHNEFPILLVDDVDAELDRKRLSRLLSCLEGRAQAFVTSAEEELSRVYSPGATTFEIVNGRARTLSAITACSELSETPVIVSANGEESEAFL